MADGSKPIRTSGRTQTTIAGGVLLAPALTETDLHRSDNRIIPVNRKGEG